MNWADNLRAAIECDNGLVSTEQMLEWLHQGERHLVSVLNALEALIEANADLRRQLYELKNENVPRT